MNTRGPPSGTGSVSISPREGHWLVLPFSKQLNKCLSCRWLSPFPVEASVLHGEEVCAAACLVIGSSRARENCGNFNPFCRRINREDNAVTPHALAQRAYKLPALDRTDIAGCGVLLHLSDCPCELFLPVSRQTAELLRRLPGETTNPVHLSALPREQTRLV